MSLNADVSMVKQRKNNMPNHVDNILTISGTDADIRRFIKQADGGKKGDHLDFQRLYPMPKELVGTSSPPAILTQKEIDAAWAKIKLVEKRKKRKVNIPQIKNCVESPKNSPTNGGASTEQTTGMTGR
jgi:hypothetical protein